LDWPAGCSAGSPSLGDVTGRRPPLPPCPARSAGRPGLATTRWHSGRPQPWAIGRSDRDVLCLAGVWDRWVDPADGTELWGVAVLTVAADAAIEALHHRMPLLLGRDEEAAWLDPGISEAELAQLLARPRSSAELRWWPVSRTINAAGADGAALITPITLELAASA
jgi:putative SOS response-associated peptidase YedK